MGRICSIMQRCIDRSTRQGRGHCTAQLHSVKEAASCLLGVVLLLAPSALAYGDGARSESCYDMMTNHTDTFSGRLAPPISCEAPCQFSIQVVARVDNENNRMRVEENITTYECDAVYEVVIRTTQNPFNGYMAEARSPTADGSFTETSSIWGEWLYSDTDDFHSVNCKHSLSSETGDKFSGAVTQDELVYPINDSVSLYWKAPGATQGELPDPLVFWVTIVESLALSFTPVNGTELTRNCEPLLPSSSSSSTIPSTTAPTPMVVVPDLTARSTSSSGSSHPLSTAVYGIAAGVVIGGILVIVFIVVVVVVVVKRKRKIKDYTPPAEEVKENVAYGVAATGGSELEKNVSYGAFNSLREQETAGATEPEHYYELDHYPVHTSSQPGREQRVDEQEYDYIDHERQVDDRQHQYELDLPPIPTSAANGNSDSNHCDQTESEDTIYN